MSVQGLTERFKKYKDAAFDFAKKEVSKVLSSDEDEATKKSAVREVWKEYEKFIYRELCPKFFYVFVEAENEVTETTERELFDWGWEKSNSDGVYFKTINDPNLARDIFDFCSIPAFVEKGFRAITAEKDREELPFRIKKKLWNMWQRENDFGTPLSEGTLWIKEFGVISEAYKMSENRGVYRAAMFECRDIVDFRKEEVSEEESEKLVENNKNLLVITGLNKKKP